MIVMDSRDREYTPTNNKTHLSTIVAPYQHMQRIDICSRFKKQITATREIKLSRHNHGRYRQRTHY